MTSSSASRPSPRTIHFEIERLILDGLPLGAGETARLHEALEAELVRLCGAAPIAAWQAGTFNQKDAGAVRFAPSRPAREWGRQIARSVFSSVTPESAPALREPTAQDGKIVSAPLQQP